MGKGLTIREQQILEFVKEYAEKNGYQPTFREIGRGVKLKSTSSISYYVQKLEDAGYVERDKYNARAIRIRN